MRRPVTAACRFLPLPDVADPEHDNWGGTGTIDVAAGAASCQPDLTAPFPFYLGTTSGLRTFQLADFEGEYMKSYLAVIHRAKILTYA